MTLTARVRQLEAQRIEAMAKLERLAARLDALEDLVKALLGAELLWLCPRCGFLATEAGACEECVKEEKQVNLLELQQRLRDMVGEDFAEASDHPYNCTCDKCREWWRRMGPDPETETFGPFGESLDDDKRIDTVSPITPR